MNTNEGTPGFSGRSSVRCQKAPVPENTLKGDQIQIERKTFAFALKENPRGCFLKITEGVGDRADTIIVPASGLPEFRRVLDEMMAAVPTHG